ncbi:MAG: phage tail assembly protein T [Acidobacteriota bacterium]
MLRAFLAHRAERQGQVEEVRQKRADWRAGTVCATIMNAPWPLVKNSRTYRPWDFFPDVRDLRRTPSDDELLAKVELLNRALGGRDLRDESSPAPRRH